MGRADKVVLVCGVFAPVGLLLYHQWEGTVKVPHGRFSYDFTRGVNLSAVGDNWGEACDSRNPHFRRSIAAASSRNCTWSSTTGGTSVRKMFSVGLMNYLLNAAGLGLTLIFKPAAIVGAQHGQFLSKEEVEEKLLAPYNCCWNTRVQIIISFAQVPTALFFLWTYSYLYPPRPWDLASTSVFWLTLRIQLLGPVLVVLGKFWIVLLTIHQTYQGKITFISIPLETGDLCLACCWALLCLSPAFPLLIYAPALLLVAIFAEIGWASAQSFDRRDPIWRRIRAPKVSSTFARQTQVGVYQLMDGPMAQNRTWAEICRDNLAIVWILAVPFLLSRVAKRVTCMEVALCTYSKWRLDITTSGWLDPFAAFMLVWMLCILGVYVAEWLGNVILPFVNPLVLWRIQFLDEVRLRTLWGELFWRDPKNLRDINGMTPLIGAAQMGKDGDVQKMLNENLDEIDAYPFSVWCKGRTALAESVIAVKEQEGQHGCVSKNYLKITIMLLGKEADPNIPDVAGMTPLMHAVLSRRDAKDRLAMVEGLLEHRADANAINNSQLTALHLAAQSTSHGEQNLVEIVQCLCRYKADVTIEDGDGRQASDWAGWNLMKCLKDLLESEEEEQSQPPKDEAYERYQFDKRINVGVIGEVSSGKSSFINAARKMEPYVTVVFRAELGSTWLKGRLTKKADDQFAAIGNWAELANTSTGACVQEGFILVSYHLNGAEDSEMVDQTLDNLLADVGKGGDTSLRFMHPDLCQVGLFETTRDKRAYQFGAEGSRVQLWDLPGCGTPNVPAETYYQQLGVQYFDVIIILFKDCFAEMQSELLSKCLRPHHKDEHARHKHKIRLAPLEIYLVFNKLDAAVASKRREAGYTAEQTHRFIRKEILRSVREKGQEFKEKDLFAIIAERSIAEELQETWPSFEDDFGKLLTRISEDAKRIANARGLPV